MRRRDREVKDASQIKDIMERCYCCRLGFIDCERVYIVPMNYGYEDNDGQIVLYFHSAKEGRKIQLLQQNPYVGFELDTNHQLLEGNQACQYSSLYESIIGEGKIEIIEDIDMKKHALDIIMKHYSTQTDWHYEKNSLKNLCVFKLIVENMSCKANM